MHIATHTRAQDVIITLKPLGNKTEMWLKSQSSHVEWMEYVSLITAKDNTSATVHNGNSNSECSWSSQLSHVEWMESINLQVNEKLEKNKSNVLSLKMGSALSSCDSGASTARSGAATARLLSGCKCVCVLICVFSCIYATIPSPNAVGTKPKRAWVEKSGSSLFNESRATSLLSLPSTSHEALYPIPIAQSCVVSKRRSTSQPADCDSQIGPADWCLCCYSSLSAPPPALTPACAPYCAAEAETCCALEAARRGKNPRRRWVSSSGGGH
jgi:hypothetical protein